MLNSIAFGTNFQRILEHDRRIAFRAGRNDIDGNSVVSSMYWRYRLRFHWKEFICRHTVVEADQPLNRLYTGSQSVNVGDQPQYLDRVGLDSGSPYRLDFLATSEIELRHRRRRKCIDNCGITDNDRVEPPASSSSVQWWRQTLSHGLAIQHYSIRSIRSEWLRHGCCNLGNAEHCIDPWWAPPVPVEAPPAVELTT